MRTSPFMKEPQKARTCFRSVQAVEPFYFPPGLLFDAREFRHSRVGSSSGSGVSCAGRKPSGTLRRFTRMRVHVDDLPRMESIKTSSIVSSFAAFGCFFFHLF